MGGLLLLGVDCLYLVLTYEPVLIWFASQFRMEDPLVSSDAIVILLGSAGDRATRAAELYHQGLAPVILMGQTARIPFDETERNRQVLIRSGVPPDAIRILSSEEVKNTHDEALRIRDHVQAHPVRRITVVTTAYHTARTRWTFRKALRGSGVEVRMAASRDPALTEANWYDNNYGIETYMMEFLKNVYYRVVY
jgi:uncharacterized SAM-binding protein YcdF (DUF218 family)